jgi:hypothetical protein
MRRYNAGVMFRPISPLLLAIALLSGVTIGCNRAPENKEAVREGVMEHLSKNSGLDLKSMDVEVGNVTFQGNQATAAVSFKPKSSPDAGMSMNYTLDRRGNQWVVQQKAGSGAAGHGGGMGAPDGAPPADSGAHAPGATPPPAGAGEALPPGHPPVAGGSGAGTKKNGAGDLPAGHPPVGASPKTK